MVPPTGSV